MRYRRLIFWGILTVFVMMDVCPGRDWPQWRGPFLNGSTDEPNLPENISPAENILWKHPLPGTGAATPIIVGGKVFISSTEKDTENLLAICLEETSGKELWRKTLGTAQQKIPLNNMASPSPASDGRHVYFMFGSGDLAALDLDGNLKWSRNLQDEYGNISNKFGYSSSPLFHKGRLYILILRRNESWREPHSKTLDSFMLSVDTRTGKNIFKQPRQTDAKDESLDVYSSPMLVKSKDREDIVIIGADFVTGHDWQTGAERWRYEYSPRKHKNWRQIPTILSGDGLLYGVKSRGSGLFALKAGATGTLSDSDVVWTFDKKTPDSSTPLLYKDHVYLMDDAGDQLTCLNARTGLALWSGELGGRAPYYASITAADDKLYLISEAAEVIILSANTKEFKFLSRTKLDENPSRSSIAIANGKLFIRTAKHLYCVGIK
ncbi:MAG: PQQ-like beta-propeller repeat protein [Sedimentisphaerales bacterium]|nr:PQQ-like beta-propeller repeat protein [Sedimentisphaerales bacterium]